MGRELGGAESRNIGEGESEDRYSKWKRQQALGREVMDLQLRTVPGVSQSPEDSCQRN